MSRTQTERRSIARRNASQTRPDQTRVLVTASSGSIQDQSCYLTVGALCSCDADAHVSYAFLGLEPIAVSHYAFLGLWNLETAAIA
jgi:hypothetical protein